MSIDKNQEQLPKPSEVGLPHKEWRKAQGLTFLDLRESFHHNNGQKFHFAQIATGGGKTGVAAAMGSVAPVTYVAATLGLLEQAEREYGFVAIKGRQEYECAHPKRVDSWQAKYGKIPTARDCHLSKMSECPHSGECPYLIKKNAALAAQRAACTYKYLALSSLFKKRQGILVLDEIHECVDEIISFCTFKMDQRTIDWWSLPKMPNWRNLLPQGESIRYKRGRCGFMDTGTKGEIENWLNRCWQGLGHFDKESEEGIKAKRLKDGIKLHLETMQGADWFLEIGNDIITKRGGKGFVDVPGMIMRPLSAQPVAKRLWVNKTMVLMMSATIGNTPDVLATEIGLDSFQFHDYPHPISAEYRPIFDLGLPRLTKRNLDQNPNLMTIQALKIAHFIESLPQEWRGIVLSSSYKKINALREILRVKLPGRIFEPSEGYRVTERIENFIRDPREGLIAVDTVQGWGHGLDLRGDLARFAIVAGVPFDNPSDPYVRARNKIPNGSKFSWWKAYNSIPQAAGRCSRGELRDDGEFLLNIGAIADGSATSPRARAHYPSWFKPQKWDGGSITE